jgi:hypothetical protein
LGVFLKMLALGGAGYAATRLFKARQSHGNAAYADDQPQDSPSAVRDAGPKAMRDEPQGEWSSIDEASDQSFPASDPPSTY